MANEIRVRSNFLFGTITDNPLTIGATTINSANFVSVPAIDNTQHAVLVLDPAGLNGTPEIVYVTAHTASTTSLTVTRGQELSTARQHPSGTQWYLAPTARDYDSIVTSATRPGVPYFGELIFETDTNTYSGRSTTGAWQTVMPLGAWTNFTPTLTQGVGVTFTNTYSRFIRTGRIITAETALAVTSNGSAGVKVQVTLPVTPSFVHNQVIGAFWLVDTSAATNYSGIALSEAGGPVIGIPNNAAAGLGQASFVAALAAGDTVAYSVTYEAAT